ncbi:MAG TPA: hypothetical protein VGN77_05825, partial [Steroidobacteraceae bacterium]|nr:hypothetical protein [Steroidobacteraceae bacterium]
MISAPAFANRRVLVIDDDPAVHDAFQRFLGPEQGAEAALLEAERAPHGANGKYSSRQCFEVDTALHRQAGVQLVQRALEAGRPYALAFVEMLTSPDAEGAETVQRLWAIDPHLQVVMSSAHATYDWSRV